MSGAKVSRVRVKMCGTTRVEDAHLAVELGVDALGFIFAEKSPRCISIDDASNIIRTLPPFIDRVGVFVDAPYEDVAACAAAGLSYLQLHGKETGEYCEKLRERIPHCKILKAFRVGEHSKAEEFSQYNECVDGFLLDTYEKGTSGGTGKVFDWAVIESLNLKKTFLLAGGISPDNVLDAVKGVRPFCLDINSGVEVSPGVKDHSKLTRLMQLVRSCH